METRPHNAKAVELFKAHLPEWLAKICIELHIESVAERRGRSGDQEDLKHAILRNIAWGKHSSMALLYNAIEGNEVKATEDELRSWFYESIPETEAYINGAKPEAEAHREAELAAASNAEDSRFLIDEERSNWIQNIIDNPKELYRHKDAIYQIYTEMCREPYFIWNAVMRDHEDGSYSPYVKEEFFAYGHNLQTLFLWSLIIRLHRDTVNEMSVGYNRMMSQFEQQRNLSRNLAGTLRQDIGNDITRMLNEIQHSKQHEYDTLRAEIDALRHESKHKTFLAWLFAIGSWTIATLLLINLFR